MNRAFDGSNAGNLRGVRRRNRSIVHLVFGCALRRQWAVLGLTLIASPVYGLDITKCGQVVPVRETAVLQADLDCSSPPSYGVRLLNRATLDLNGHSIIGGTGYDVLSCNVAKRCTIIGPGTISGGQVAIYAAKHLTVQNVTIHDAVYGVYAGSSGVLRISDVSVDHLGVDVYGVGISGGRVEATNVSAINCGDNGIQAFRALRATNLVANNNGGAGVRAARSFIIDGLVANNNGQTPLHEGAGLDASRHGRLSNATLTGNKYSSPFLAQVDVDIFARRSVAVTNVTCDHSLRFITIDESGAPWGYCAAD